MNAALGVDVDEGREETAWNVGKRWRETVFLLLPIPGRRATNQCRMSNSFQRPDVFSGNRELNGSGDAIHDWPRAAICGIPAAQPVAAG
jgi:hypothetical protein